MVKKKKKVTVWRKRQKLRFIRRVRLRASRSVWATRGATFSRLCGRATGSIRRPNRYFIVIDRNGYDEFSNGPRAILRCFRFCYPLLLLCFLRAKPPIRLKYCVMLPAESNWRRTNDGIKIDLFFSIISIWTVREIAYYDRTILS